MPTFLQAPAAASPTAAPAAEAAAVAAGAIAAGPAPAAESAEHFYDAVELPLPPLPSVPAVPAAVPSGDGLRFEDAALLYLRYMCRTGDQTVGLLQVGAVLWAHPRPGFPARHALKAKTHLHVLPPPLHGPVAKACSGL